MSVDFVNKIGFPFLSILIIACFDFFQNLNFHACQAVAWQVEVITSGDTNNLVAHVASIWSESLAFNIFPVFPMYLLLHFWQIIMYTQLYISHLTLLVIFQTSFLHIFTYGHSLNMGEI